MNGKINLCIVTKDKVFRIPFATIRQLDMFTVRYNNDCELINSLIRILDLPVDFEEVKGISMQYVYSDKILPIKYFSDNYNVDSVISSYVYYLQSDQRRLDGYGIRNVVKVLEPNYKNMIFDNSYVEILAKRYLKNDYRKIRDAYFLVKKYMIVKIDKVKPRKKHEEGMKYSDVDDNYVEYLISCFNRSEEDYMMALEELSMMDLKELEMKLGSYSLGVIDGVKIDDYDQCDLDDIKELVRLTGIDIETLRQIVNYNNGYKKKR